MSKKILLDDLHLFHSMRKMARQNQRNTPGPYWEKTAKAAIQEIEKKRTGKFSKF
jgi:hypothetical protein